jgi:AraC-like DNA-binding protein
MKNAPYSGHLKGLYLEAKAIELFLLQVKQLDQQTGPKLSKLKPTDIERLYAVKEHINKYYDQSCSIIGLAQLAGINQMKLKDGFKELFGTTVFGYINDVRMNEAKRLLLDEKLYVNEVADRVGYKHPQHFTIAFKKKFGIAPKELKA